MENICKRPTTGSEHQKQEAITRTENVDDDDVQIKDLLGVSVYHLNEVFLPQIRDEGFSEATKFYEIENLSLDSPGIVRRRGQHLLCPFDHLPGCAYVHTISGIDHVGPATHMLSWTWGYTVGDVCLTLLDFCKEHQLDPRRTYIWMCCLCVNQHRVAASNKSGMLKQNVVDFEKEFQSHVVGIGHVLAMMGPWDSPAYLKRAWCIFELYTAISNDCDITIVMPPKERDCMARRVLGSSGRAPNKPEEGGVDALYKTLADISVQDAQASIEADRERIMTILKNSRIGFDVVNKSLANFLRQWVRRAIGVLVKEQEEYMEFGTVSNNSDNAKDSSNQRRASYAAFCSNVAMLFQRNGEYEAAIKMYQKSLIIYETDLGREHIYFAATLSNIGAVLMAQGCLDEALQKHCAALDIQKKIWDDDHQYMATTYTNIAHVLQGQGDFKNALEHYRKAALICDNTYGSKHQATATCYSCIGSLLLLRGDYQAALKEYTRALEIFLQVFTRNHPLVGKTYSDVGRTHHGLGNYSKAIEYQHIAIEVQEKILGIEHADTATSYLNMARSLQSTGKYDHALNMYHNALETFERVVGDNHPTTAACYCSIGSVHHAMKNYPESIEMYRKALAFYENSTSFNESHFSIGRTYSELGSVLCDNGDMEGAFVMLKKALEIQEGSLAPNHPSLATTYVNMGRALQSTGKYNEAMTMLKKAEAIQLQALPENHPTMAMTYYCIGSLQRAKGDIPRALASYKKCLDSQEKTLGKEHRLTVKTKSRIRSLESAQEVLGTNND